MRKLAVALIVLLLAALLGGAAILVMTGGAGDRPERPVRPPHSPEPDATAWPAARERVRVRNEPAPAADVASPQPVAPIEEPPVVEEVTEADAGGVLTVIDGESGEPLIGVDVGFLLRDAVDGRPQGVPTFDLAVTFGRMLRTGMDGTVRVPQFEGFALVVAQSGGLRGETWIDDEEHVWTLTLRTTHAVRVRVVDASGAPVAGVPVAVRALGSSFDWAIAKGESGPDGSAEIMFQLQDGVAALDVALLIAMEPRPAARIDVSKLPEAPIELRLPETGSLRIEVLGPDGQEWTAPARVWVAAQADGVPMLRDEALDAERSTSADAVDGVVVLQRIPLGQRLLVTVGASAPGRGLRSETVAGPASPGEQVVHRIEVGPVLPTVVGRLEYDDGTPAAGIELVAQLLSTGGGLDTGFPDMSCTTGDDGAFSFVLTAMPEEGAQSAIQIGRQREVGPRSYRQTTLATCDLPMGTEGGELDLGTVTIPLSRLVAAGRVIGPEGKPLGGATVTVMQSTFYGTVPHEGVPEVVTDAAGAFTLQGAVESETAQIACSADGCYAESYTEVAAGATEVTLRMLRAGAIAGSVRIPDGMEFWAVQVSVHGDVADNHDTRHRREGEHQIGTYTERDGTFVLESLRPGTATVFVRIGWNDDDTVLTVADLQVVAGETLRDPRLQDIDLAALLHTLRVTVLGSDREPLAGAAVHASIRDEGGFTYWQEFTCDGEGVALVRTKSPPGEIVAIARDHACGSVTSPDGDRVIVLQRSRPTAVTLRLTPGTPIPDPPFELTPELVWVGPLGSTGTSDEHGMDDPRSASSIYVEGGFGKDKTRVLRAEHPGRYRVDTTLWQRRMDGASGRSIATVPEVLIVTVPGDGKPITVEVAYDPEEITSRTAQDE